MTKSSLILEAAVEFAQTSMPTIAAYFQGSLALIYSDIGLIEATRSLCDQLLEQSETTPAFWRLADLAYALQTRLHLIDRRFNGGSGNDPKK